MRAILDEVSSPRAEAPRAPERDDVRRGHAPRAGAASRDDERTQPDRLAATTGDQTPTGARRSPCGREVLQDVVAMTQADLLALQHARIVRGTLVLAGPGVYDLSPLSGLEEVGALVVTETRLRSLAGLRALRVVRGDVVIATDGLRAVLDGVDVGGSIIVR